MTAKSLVRPARRGQALAHRGHRHLVQEALVAERHDQQAVGVLGGRAGQPRAERTDVDRRRAVGVLAGAECRRHQRVPVVLAAEVEPLARLPGIEDRPQRRDQLGHPRHRLVELRAEPLLDLRADLRAQAERKPALAEQLEVDRLMGEMNRVAGKRNCDVGHQIKTADGRRQRERGEDVVGSLEGENPARARIAVGPRLLDRIDGPEQRCHHLHDVRA